MKNIKSIIEHISELREKMKSFIESLPEAHTGVNLLSKNPRCGTVSLSTISKNKGILAPSYYLNTTAKEELIRILETTKIESLESRINQIIETGRLEVSGRKIELNPEFIEELKNIWKI